MRRCLTTFLLDRCPCTDAVQRRLAALALLLIACARAENAPGPEGGTAGAPGGAGSLSEAEWLAQTGPQPGEHEVYDAACGGERIPQDYRITPRVGCAVRRDENGTATTTRDCVVEDYCSSSADCTAQPGGVCSGGASASCEYAGVDLYTDCDSDDDCDALQGGSCAARIEGGGELCYPTGECRTTPLQGCAYPVASQPCASDADCTAAPGGSCRRSIHFTECTYNECEDTSDCRPGARCECFGVRSCIRADCFADADCGAGYRCEPSLALQCGNLEPPVGYHCHAANDECQGDTDCDGPSCVFDPAVSRWACREIGCLTR
jgi:hypothetical protein